MDISELELQPNEKQALVIGAPRWEEMRGFSLYLNVIHDAAGLKIEGEELVLEPAGLVK